MPVVLLSGTCWSVGSSRQERWRNLGDKRGWRYLEFVEFVEYIFKPSSISYLKSYSCLLKWVKSLMYSGLIRGNCHFHINASWFATSMAYNRKHSTCKETLFRDFYWSLYCQVGCEVWLMWKKAYRLPKVNAPKSSFCFQKIGHNEN